MSNHQALQIFGRSGNPAMSDATFRDEAPKPLRSGATGDEIERQYMTLEGTVNKTGILLLLVLVAASIPWNLFFSTNNPGVAAPFMLGGFLVGMVMALITIFKKQWAGVTAPIYALAQGLAMGGISAFAEAQYPGIVIQAMGLTFGTLASLLLCYKTGVIKPTENFRLMVVSATMGIGVLYMVSWIMSFFGSGIGFIHSNGIFGIGFSLFVVGIAALNLVLDFDFIEQGAEHNAPKYMEWFGAFSLMVTLIWLYLEILRLLMKLRSR